MGGAPPGCQVRSWIGSGLLGNKLRLNSFEIFETSCFPDASRIFIDSILFIQKTAECFLLVTVQRNSRPAGGADQQELSCPGPEQRLCRVLVQINRSALPVDCNVR